MNKLLSFKEFRQRVEAKEEINADSFLNKCNWFLLLKYKEVPFHYVGFETVPDQHNINLVIDEMENDKDFGIGNKIKNTRYSVLDKDEIQLIRLNTIDEIDNFSIN